MPITGFEKAKRLFQESGLAFPTIPDKLAAQLKEQGKWLFSTRKINMSPYNLKHYVAEVDKSRVQDYAMLSHSGHGINSYALQYYLVHGSLRMFLHLGWGGAYMDDKAARTNIRNCFSMAAQIIRAAKATEDRLTIVGSDFYGSYWEVSGEICQMKTGSKGPAEVLAEVLLWLTNPRT